MINIIRYVVPSGTQVSVGEDGFLPDPDLTYGSLQNPQAVDVDTLSSASALGVLGDPGLGKTTVLHRMADLAAPRTKQVWVDLFEVTDLSAFAQLVEQPLKVALSALPTISAAMQDPAVDDVQMDGTEPIAIILDGVDECPVDARTFARWVERLIQQVEVRRIQLFVGCRTADWPQSLDQMFQRDLSSWQVVQLAPLRRADIVTWADAQGIDPDAFLHTIGRAGAGPLAAIPITLRLLTRLFQEQRALPRRTVELYRDGLLALSEEWDSERRQAMRFAPQGARLTALQRMAVASRVAAYLQLGGRTALWRGGESEALSTDLRLSELVGGVESVGAGEFSVSADSVLETLATGLFTGLGSDRLVFAHHTFLAYLTAHYLTERLVPEPQLRSLLVSIAATGRAAIQPALREIAAWLVCLDPNRHGWLIEVDPETIASYSFLTEHAGVRAALVERLLALAAEGTLRAPFAVHFPQLAHPGLADQLRLVLQDGTLEQQTLALDIADGARPGELVEDLLQFALDGSHLAHLRAEAAQIASGLDRARAAERLLPLTPDPGDDPDDELRGAVLEACWPDVLSTETLIERLTPPQNRNLVGGYAVFRMRLPQAARDEDLAVLLRWAGQQAERHRQRTYSTRLQLEEELLVRAWSSSRRGEFLPVIAEVLLLRLRAHQHQHPLPLVDEEITSETADRRALVLAMLQQAQTPPPAWYLAGTGLMRDRDLAWLLEQEEAATEPRARHLRDLIRQVFRPLNPDHQRLAWERENTSLWGEVFQAYFAAVPLESEEARRQREIYAEQQASIDDASEERADDEQRMTHLVHLAELLNQAVKGADPTAFSRFCWAAQFDPATRRGSVSLADDLTQQPGYQVLSLEAQAQVAHAAEQYLRIAESDEIWLANGTSPDWQAISGYLAFALLERCSPDRLERLPTATWDRWAMVLLWYPSSDVNAGDPECKRRLVARLAAGAPSALMQAAVRYLRAASAAGVQAWELKFLTSGWTDELAVVLAQELHDLRARADIDNYLRLLRLLLESGQEA
jgi:hypothetical protein